VSAPLTEVLVLGNCNLVAENHESVEMQRKVVQGLLEIVLVVFDVVEADLGNPFFEFRVTSVEEDDPASCNMSMISMIFFYYLAGI